MKRTFSILIALLLCFFTFAGCDDTSADHMGEDNLQRVYIYQESDEVVKPIVTLFEDHKFSFTFSAVSSYLGIGTYTIEDDFLILNTDDGVYTYTFKIEGEDRNRLIFLAEKSSDYLHQGNFEDGAVFEEIMVLPINSN